MLNYEQMFIKPDSSNNELKSIKKIQIEQQNCNFYDLKSTRF